MADISYTISIIDNPARFQLGYNKDQTIDIDVPDTENIEFKSTQIGYIEYGIYSESFNQPPSTYTVESLTSDKVYTLKGPIDRNVYGTYTHTMACYLNASGTKVTGKTLTLNLYNNFYADFKYNINGGSGTTPAGYKDTINGKELPAIQVMVTSETPTKSGYTFLGWSKNQHAPGSGTAEYHAWDNYDVKYQTESYPTDDVLYAVWGNAPTGNTVKAKHDGTWKEGTAYAKSGGTWKQAASVHGKTGGEWK